MSVFIRYCNGWGYMGRFQQAKRVIEKEFNGLSVIGQPGVGGSGAFEIYYVDNGKETLLHSKLNGEGFINPENEGNLISKIKKLRK